MACDTCVWAHPCPNNHNQSVDRAKQNLEKAEAEKGAVSSSPENAVSFHERLHMSMKEMAGE